MINNKKLRQYEYYLENANVTPFECPKNANVTPNERQKNANVTPSGCQKNAKNAQNYEDLNFFCIYRWEGVKNGIFCLYTGCQGAKTFDISKVFIKWQDPFKVL